MLDYTVYSDVERADYVKKELTEYTKTPSAKELETMANYILFGKDSNDQNAVDRGEVTIQTKYSSYTKKKDSSLDELLETPTFNEGDLKPLKRTIYKNPKPVLRDIPELKTLKSEIATVEKNYNTLVMEGETSPTKLYHLKHYLIDLKKQQYVIQDAATPSSHSTAMPQHYTFPASLENLGENCYPLGLKIGNSARFDNPMACGDRVSPVSPDTITLDFTNQSHIYLLIEFYSSLLETSYNNPYDNTKYLLETLDFYAKFAGLSESRYLIYTLKCRRYQNSEIATILLRDLGIHYNENYISTIYKNDICPSIADAAKLHFAYWENKGKPYNFKKCSCCGKIKLVCSEEFIRRKASKDGFSSRCKVCETLKRKEAKEKKLQKEAK